MKKRLICLTILIIFLLTIIPTDALELNINKTDKILNLNQDKTEEILLITTFPYAKDCVDIKFTGGNNVQIRKIKDILESNNRIFTRRKTVNVEDISFNITYSNQRLRRITFSYLHMAWFIPYFDYDIIINKPFVCSIKNFTGDFYFYRFDLHTPFSESLLYKRIAISGICYNGTASVIT